MEQKGIRYLLDRVYYHTFGRFKPLTVHTEAIFLDNVWEEVKKKALSGQILKWYVMTPANYDYFKVFFNIKPSKKQLSKIMKERYKWLLNHNQKLELHVHLARLMNISYQEQEKLIKESINWMKKELGIEPKEMVGGWWEYNEDTLKILKKYGLGLIKQNRYRTTHDYNWIEINTDQSLFVKKAIKKYCKGEKVLDLGCGNLVYSTEAKKASAKEIIAVDIIKPKKVIEGIKFFQEDAQKTHFKDNSFDVIICIGLIEYINLERGIAELKRLIKPNGIIMFQTKDSRGRRHRLYTTYCKLKGKSILGQPQKFKGLYKRLKENFKILNFKQTKPKHNVFFILKK